MLRCWRNFQVITSAQKTYSRNEAIARPQAFYVSTLTFLTSVLLSTWNRITLMATSSSSVRALYTSDSAELEMGERLSKVIRRRRLHEGGRWPECRHSACRRRIALARRSDLKVVLVIA
jgi:hypothetical protein